MRRPPSACLQVLALTLLVVAGLGPAGQALGMPDDRVAPVTGSPATPRIPGASTADTTIRFEMGSRERLAIVVNQPPPGERRPAVLILHGGMGSAAQMRATSGFDAVARKEGFMAVYPEGTEFGSGRHAWNTGHLLRRQVRDSDDVAYLDALIERLVTSHGADPARIFMTGGSNGGMMTFVYAVARAERLAAIAPVVASMFTFEKVPSVPLPIIVINGAKDAEVPLVGGMSENRLVRAAQGTPFKPVSEVVAFWVRANRSKAEGVARTDGTVTTTTYAATEGGAVTEFVLDADGGHGWPGSRSRRGDNAPIAAFRGAERVWAFFRDKSRAPQSAAAAPVRHRIKVIDFPDLEDPTRPEAAAGRRVPIKVHLPAIEGARPVVVVSHGAGGSRDTHFAQAQDLAAHGYAVLCVEHVGSGIERLQDGLRPMKNIEAMTRDSIEVLGRPRDVSFAIDRAAEWNQSHDRLRGRLDLDRIGAMGHSFGAYTTMAACGMRPVLDWLMPRVEPGRGLGPDLADPRIRCGVALSPQGPGEPFFLPESYASLRVPLLGISGSKDVQQAGRTAGERKDAFALWPAGGSRFVWITGASHLDFADSSGSEAPALPSRTRADVQPIVRAATRAFFDLHLRSDPTAAGTLSSEGLKPYLRGGAQSVEVLSR